MMNIQDIQRRHAQRITNGEKFWGYLDTEALQSRYAVAAHFLQCRNIVEIGGYRTDIAHYLNGHNITIYSLDLEFMPIQSPGIMRIQESFAKYHPPHHDFALLALGLDVGDDIDHFLQWEKQAKRVIIEGPLAHPPTRRIVELILQIPHKEIAYINFDFRRNQDVLNIPSIAPVLRENLIRSMYILEPLSS